MSALGLVACAGTSSHQALASAAGSEALAEPESPPPQPERPGFVAFTEPGELPNFVVLGGNSLPLRHTHVNAQVRGHVAEVVVAQRFVNESARAIEAIYTFPLPENSAVDGMRFTVAGRVIESEVQRRARARRTYEDARASGYATALLEQDRPNLFTQSLANIPPGESVDVEIHYLQTLSSDAGEVEFVFPMVVGPRFEAPDGAPEERIHHAYAGPGERSGHDISLDLDVQVGRRVETWDAPTHRVSGQGTAVGFSVALADAQTIPNRDFVVRWKAADANPRATLFLGPSEGGGGHFSLVVEPPELDLDELVGRREIVFVVDRSGSMRGVPLALAKRTLREALDRLRPVDTFNVVGFASGTQKLWERPRPANEQNLVLAERFIDGMQSSGGTMMGRAVDAALAPELEPGRNRYVLFLTDGFIDNEKRIMAAASDLVRRGAKAGTRSRVFAIGIGPAPNRHLLEGIARAGDGLATVVTNREGPARAVETWTRAVDHRILSDLAVDWRGLLVDEVQPRAPGDLFASRALVVLGRYEGLAPRHVTVSADAGERGRVVLPARVVPAKESSRAMATLWAREKIASIELEALDGFLEPDEAAEAITEIGLDHGLVTAFTSRVAVDRSRVVGDGHPDAVRVRGEVPEDVDPVSSGAIDAGREFTSVVEMAPTASRDSAGISLAGTTGAESKYMVEGADVTAPAARSQSLVIDMEQAKALPVGSSTSRDFTAVVDLAPQRMMAGPSVVGMGSGGPGMNVVSQIAVEGPKPFRRAAKRLVRDAAFKLRTCSEERSLDGRRTVSFVLAFDDKGRLQDIRYADGDTYFGGLELEPCLRAVLLDLDWEGSARHDDEVTLTITLFRG